MAIEVIKGVDQNGNEFGMVPLYVYFDKFNPTKINNITFRMPVDGKPDMEYKFFINPNAPQFAKVYKVKKEVQQNGGNAQKS